MQTNNIKIPPDKYITYKTSLKKIIKDKKHIDTLFDVAFRTNQLVIHTYQFLRLWILHKYNNKINIPIIDLNTIRMAFKALSSNDPRGGKTSNDNNILLDEFNTFYISHYKKLNYSKKIDSKYLSQIIISMSTDMLTNIENNIKLNFFNYVRRFVNSSFKKQINDLVDKEEEGKKYALRKQLNKEIQQVKLDLLNNTLKSNEKFHNWIIQHRGNIFFKEFKNSYEFDVQNYPQKYLKSMIYMCLELEKLDTKSFQFFPLRNNIAVKYFPLDTRSIIDILFEKNKLENLLDITNRKHEIWNKYFKLDNDVFKNKNYVFDYKIYTDCFSVSIQMINKNNVEEENKKKSNMKNKRIQFMNDTKNMNEEEKKEYKNKLAKDKKDKEVEFKLKLKEQRDKQKEEFNKLSKEDKDKLVKKCKEESLEAKIKKEIECPYIDDLSDEQLKELDKNNWVVVDPGVNSLLTMKDKNGKSYRYSNRKRLRITKRIKYQKLIQNYKNKNDISHIEKELANYNSKTCDIEKFKKFIKNKNIINRKLFDDYNEDIFRKYKWYGYINRQRADSLLINEIGKTFGKESIICYGDASLKGCCDKGNYSTPNLRLKRLIQKNFKMYNLDEFKTSKLHYKTEETGNNLYVKFNKKNKNIKNKKNKKDKEDKEDKEDKKDKKDKKRKLHSVLTFKMENGQSGCINRDENAVNNMIKIVNSQIKNKERPLRYRRSITLDKDINFNNETKTDSEFKLELNDLDSKLENKQQKAITSIKKSKGPSIAMLIVDTEL